MFAAYMGIPGYPDIDLRSPQTTERDIDCF